jgi:hypothetical protein
LIEENQVRQSNENNDEVIEEILCHSRKANKLIQNFVKREEVLKSVSYLMCHCYNFHSNHLNLDTIKY